MTAPSTSPSTPPWQTSTSEPTNLCEQEAGQLVPFELDKVKVLQRRLQPQDARGLAPLEVQCYIDHFSELVERPVAEQEGLRETGALVEPYWDTRLRRDRALRLDLYRALHRCGLLGFCFRRKARAGLFTVKKKNGLQRLIVDGRQANAQHRPPPTTRLSTPSGLTSLDLSETTLLGNGFGDYDAKTGETRVQPSAETGDVADCFYNFTIPALSGWFAFDDAFTRDELYDLDIDPGDVYDHDIGKAREIQMGFIYGCSDGVEVGSLHSQ